jgi:hypothetical protein
MSSSHHLALPLSEILEHLSDDRCGAVDRLLMWMMERLSTPGGGRRASPVPSPAPSPPVTAQPSPSHWASLPQDILIPEGGRYLRMLSSLPLELLRVEAVKFLVAQRWDVGKAERMWLASLHYRNETCSLNFKLETCPFPIRGWDLAAVDRRLLLDISNCTGLEESTERAEKSRELTPTPASSASSPMAQQTNPLEERMVKLHHTIRRVYNAGFHKWDRAGRPVFIERSGMVNTKGLFRACSRLASGQQTPSDVCAEYQMFVNEIGARLTLYSDVLRHGPNSEDEHSDSAASGKENTPGKAQPLKHRAFGMVLILDCTGLSYSGLYRPSLDLLKRAFEVDAMCYPEGLHAVYCVNAGKLISVAFNIIKGWLDPRVRSKITFVSPEDTQKVLLTLIAPEHLPCFLGGRCSCESGCVPTAPIDEDSPLSSPTSVVETHGTSGFSSYADSLELHIPHGSKGKVRKEYAIAENQTLLWEWEAPGEALNFTASFSPSRSISGQTTPLSFSLRHAFGHVGSAYCSKSPMIASPIPSPANAKDETATTPTSQTPTTHPQTLLEVGGRVPLTPVEKTVVLNPPYPGTVILEWENPAWSGTRAMVGKIVILS